MAVTEKRRTNCPIKHINAYIVKYDDGSFKVKCSSAKTCGDSCPFLKDPDYRSPYKRAPQIK